MKTSQSHHFVQLLKLLRSLTPDLICLSAALIKYGAAGCSTSSRETKAINQRPEHREKPRRNTASWLAQLASFTFQAYLPSGGTAQSVPNPSHKYGHGKA